jgi:hypothetical protein
MVGHEVRDAFCGRGGDDFSNREKTSNGRNESHGPLSFDALDNFGGDAFRVKHGWRGLNDTPSVVAGIAIERSMDGSREDTADPNAGALQFLAKSTGQPVYRMLRRHIRTHVRYGEFSKNRYDVDDRTPALSPEVGQYSADAVHIAKEISFDHPAKIFSGHIFEIAVHADCGIVDPCVNLAELAHCP